jgi:toxin YoeB
MKIQFTKNALKDLEYWEKNDPKKADRIEQLCNDIERHPFKGIGKPEPLQWGLQGYWSCRINKKHRLTYAVEKDSIVIISCRHHY